MVNVKFVLGSPASLITNKDKERILTISDLHIGLEYELQRLGFRVPSQTSKIVKGLCNLLALIKPDVLVILGDVKHEIRGLRKKVKIEVEGFLRKLLDTIGRVVIVMGNHDGSLKRLKIDGIEVYEASGISIGDVSFVHGNAWPKLELLKGNVLVMGHLHPSILRHNEECRVWVVYHISKKVREEIRRSLKIDVNIKKLIVHPAYNDYLGHSPLSVKSFQKLSPIFRGLINPLRGYVYGLDGTFIGRVSSVTSGIK
ncbi:MAG: metallophosphoesterase [Candidatus Nezhaarchaeales archaeon]